jgi:hypothetical protein
MRKAIFFSLLSLVFILLAACGSSDQIVNIEVESNPTPAAVGDIELVFTLIDGNGNPIEGATVDVFADHIDMTGMDMSGTATEQGNGKYAIRANFSMTGNWKLTISIRKGSLNYQEDIDFKIQ